MARVAFRSLIKLEPSSRECTIKCFNDADHARGKVPYRLVIGITLLVNSFLAVVCKMPENCETSTYGLELVGVTIGNHLVIKLRYKLRY